MVFAKPQKSTKLLAFREHSTELTELLDTFLGTLPHQPGSPIQSRIVMCQTQVGYKRRRLTPSSDQKVTLENSQH